jgi:outer membrane protein assembly factor BamB
VRRAAVRIPCLLAFLGAAAGLPPLAADDWPLWLGPTGDGVSAETGWRKDWPESGPPRLFEKAVGEGYSAVAVAKGRLVLFHRQGKELRIEALDPLTGKEGWHFAYPTDFTDRYGYNGGPRCAPIAGAAGGKDLVFALGPTGVLHALALGTGELAWKRDLQGEHGLAENFFGVGAAPLLDGGVVYVHLGGTDLGTGLAFALEAATGKTLWKTPTDGGSYAAARLAEIDGARHLFVFHRGGLSDLDPASGRERWKFPWYSRTYESVNAATPLVIGDALLFTATYGTGAVALRVRKEAHEVIWQDDLRAREKKLDCHWSTPIHREGHLYGFAGRHEQGSDLGASSSRPGRCCGPGRATSGAGR